MSWTFAVHRLSGSLHQIGTWYREFMQRSEVAFQSMHTRVSFLEQHLQGPTDEQVERMLLKILAERFGATDLAAEPQTSTKQAPVFVKPPESEISILRAIPIDPAVLCVDPKEVPTKAYGETLEMLEKGLISYPHFEDGESVAPDTESKDDDAMEDDDEALKHRRPW